MTEVLFVGTSDAFGAGGRRQSAVLVRGERGALLLDCGVTTNSGLAQMGIPRDEIETIVVSHFHGDHFGGIPLLLLAANYEDRRTHAIHIAGPPGIERRVRELAQAMGHAIRDDEWGFPIQFSELRPGITSEIGPAEISAFETRHQLEANPHGYRLSLGRETMVYSGDTGWFEQLPDLAAGADLFVCECTFHSRSLDFHLNLTELEAQRDRFDCGRIVLTHLGSEMASRRGTVSFETADDGLSIKL